jgi:hypothetical protein
VEEHLVYQTFILVAQEETDHLVVEVHALQQIIMVLLPLLILAVVVAVPLLMVQEVQQHPLVAEQEGI